MSSAESPLPDRVWRNARLATMAQGVPALGRIDDGLIAAKDGIIVYAGPAAEAPDFATDDVTDCGGRWITPGLIDPHTHLIWAGDRSGEFELRLRGATYEEIARAGGGIVSTVRSTRLASEDELVALADRRLTQLMAEGVTTVEIKSGYGLSLEHERKLLKAARRLGELHPVEVKTTFLGAHAMPPEFPGTPNSYIDEVVENMLPALSEEGLVDAVDVFCEGIGFNATQSRRVLNAATKLGLPVKMHAEQLSNMHGAELAALFSALSADHLEHLDDAGVRAMARAGTIATLLPGAFYFTRETRVPPIDALRRAGVPISLATDCNPGSSPLASPLTAMNLAATLWRLTVDECLIGFTRNAARALGLGASHGTLEAGKVCDLAIWDIARPAELIWGMGLNPLWRRVWRGN
jgi:imidazolonepropionase